MKEYVLNKLMNSEVFSSVEKEVIKDNIDVVKKVYELATINFANEKKNVLRSN